MCQTSCKADYFDDYLTWVHLSSRLSKLKQAPSRRAKSSRIDEQRGRVEVNMKEASLLALADRTLLEARHMHWEEIHFTELMEDRFGLHQATLAALQKA